MHKIKAVDNQQRSTAYFYSNDTASDYRQPLQSIDDTASYTIINYLQILSIIKLSYLRSKACLIFFAYDDTY